MIRKSLAVMACATALTAPAFAQTFETELADIVIEPFAQSLALPWGLAFLPDGTMLVTERGGTLVHVDENGEASDPIEGVLAVDSRGQGGLLGIAIDPDFETNRYVYWSFSEPGEGDTNSTAVARGVLAEDFSALADVEVIFSQTPKLPSTLHFGSRLVFDNDGYLFITTGERSDAEFRDQSQDLDSHLGKVIRILPDGTVPEDNPFVDVEGALPEIWSYGHRNIQGAALHPETGELWVVDHGPRGGDELNRIVAGGNYGWPLVTEGIEYSGAPIDPPAELPDDLIAPDRTWSPSPAPSGFTFYTGELFPEWQGDAFFGALAGTNLIRIDFDGEEVLGDEFLLPDFPERVRDVVEGPDGALYLLTDSPSGSILRVSPQ